MKSYKALIALVIVIILGIIVFTTRDKPVEKIKAPFSIAKVEKLSRIELTQPGEQGGLVVLEFGEDGWVLTKPVAAPVAERLSDMIADAFDSKINTDDRKLPVEKAEEFGLSDKDAVKVGLFPENATAAIIEFHIGKTFTVDGTRAKRTYIKTTEGKVYSAQTALGEVLGKPLSELRSKTIQKMDRAAVSEIKVKYQDESKNISLTKPSAEWTLKGDADFQLERSATSTIVNSVSNLVASGFVDNKSPAELGLDPWYAQVLAKEKDGKPMTLLISEPREGKTYVKTEKGKHIFEIAATTATINAARISTTIGLIWPVVRSTHVLATAPGSPTTMPA